MIVRLTRSEVVMSDKPSLYVVEKKEVVILVMLFVLVTVLSFTLGVRYGESVGRKSAHEQELAAVEHGEEAVEVAGGSLGKGAQKEAVAKHDEHGAAPAKDEKSDHGEHKAEHGAPKDEHANAGGHGAPHSEPAKHDSHSPEAEAKASVQASAGQPSNEAIDKKSDDYLLNALKDAGVEPPGGKAPRGAKLPDEVKETKAAKAQGGFFVIQVGSHPTRTEAEAQVRALKAKRVVADILVPFKDRQGEWHRVVVGSFKTKREADREAGGMKGKGAITSYFVWRLP